MCDQHLLGEHVEMHMFVGCLKQDKSIAGYIDNDLVEVHNIGKRHDRLVKEMKRRGFKHKSKLPEYKQKNEKLGKVDTVKNKKELFKRCKKCRVKK